MRAVVKECFIDINDDCPLLHSFVLHAILVQSQARQVECLIGQSPHFGGILKPEDRHDQVVVAALVRVGGRAIASQKDKKKQRNQNCSLNQDFSLH